MRTDLNEYLPTPETEVPPRHDAAAENARPSAVRLFDAVRLAEDHPNMLFRRRVLKRGESWLVTAPTGVGKSVLSVEWAMLWALGRGHLGFDPVRPLRSLIFVAEDDEDEMAWFRDGITRSHDFSDEDRAAINERVEFVPVCDTVGADFIRWDVIPNAERFRPDLLHLNPALAYIGAEANDQAQVAAFLRGQWQPVLTHIRAGSFVSHHTPKPPANRKQEPQRFTADLSYSGLGSVEWSNWPRGILALQPTERPGVFKLAAPKRGQRLGWTDTDGNPTVIRHIAHTIEAGSLGWRDADPENVPKAAGRPKSGNPESVLGLLNGRGLETKAWQKLAADELGVGRTVFYEIRSALEAAGRIYRSPLDGWRVRNMPSGAPKSGKSGKSGNPISEPSPESPPPKGGADGRTSRTPDGSRTPDSAAERTS